MTAATTWRDYLGLDDEALLAQCAFDRFRASGPGGQKRNKTESAVRLRHAPTGLTGEANESRSQHENRARALRRLRLALATTARETIDPHTYTPSPGLRAALGRAPGRRTPEFLSAVAELFDVLQVCEWRMSDAAKALGVTSAAVGRLLAADDDVWRAAAEQRQALGLPALRSG